jgi:hypothetical protein
MNDSQVILNEEITYLRILFEQTLLDRAISTTLLQVLEASLTYSLIIMHH